MHSATAVGVRGFEVPLHADVPIFIKRELSGAAGEIECFEVGRWGATTSVRPGCGLTLIERR